MIWLACLSFLLSACQPAKSLKLIGTWPSGSSPQSLALSSDETMLAVACADSNDIWLYRLDETAKLVKRIPLERAPSHILFSSETKQVFVSLSSVDHLIKINLNDFRILHQAKTGPNPGDFSLSEDGKHIFLSCRGDQALSVLRAQDLFKEKEIPLGGAPHGIWIAENRKKAYVATQQSDSLSEVYLPDRSLSAAIQAGPKPSTVVLSPDGAFAYVACEGEEDAAPNTGGAVVAVRLRDWVAADRVNVGAGASSLACSPSGHFIFVCCSKAERLEVISTQKGLQKVATLALKGGPTQLKLRKDGKIAYVTLSQGNQIAAIDLEAYP